MKPLKFQISDDEEKLNSLHKRSVSGRDDRNPKVHRSKASVHSDLRGSDISESEAAPGRKIVSLSARQLSWIEPSAKKASVNHVDGFLRDGVEGCYGF